MKNLNTSYIVLLKQTCQRLDQFERADVNRLEDNEIQLDGNRVVNAKNFLLSRALPNFYFHSATAYDILRTLGVPIGKMDFLGERRLIVG